jgi:hypothetical protein
LIGINRQRDGGAQTRPNNPFYRSIEQRGCRSPIAPTHACLTETTMTPMRYLVTLAVAALLPLAARADDTGGSPPPPMDLSGWVQLSSADLYGPQWPKADPADEEGVNPAYAAWNLPVTDPRPVLFKHHFDTVTREWTHGDPPVTESYQALRDISVTIWIGDDGNLHSFTHYVFETKPTVIDENFIGMLVVPDGESAEALRDSLTDRPLPLDITAYRNVTTVPEPATAVQLAAGLGLALAVAWRQRRRPTGGEAA